jgi:serine/threonine protein kinase
VCRKILDDDTQEHDPQVWRQLWAKRRRYFRKRDAGDYSAGPFADSQHDDSPQVLAVDGFEILEVLGRGGSGVVYKALQVKLNRMVALKVLAAGIHATPRARSRLRAESETIAGFNHPNVVTIHDFGEHQGVPYLCLELVEGGSLADWLTNRTEPVPAPESARIVAALARVVQEAHNLAIVHRDLKPGNVLLTGPLDDPPDTGRLKLTDFGLAKRLLGSGTSSSSSSGMVLGTPSYMAPEQAGTGNGDVGPAVDVYGLGAILYELLTLRAPFRGESPFETVFQVLSQPPQPPSALNPAVPLSLEAICLRCLEKNPARRFGSAAELADVLDQFVAGSLPAHPGPGSAPARRGWLAAAVGAGIAVVSLIAFLGLRPVQRRDRDLALTPPIPTRIDITPPPSGVSVTQGVEYHEKGRIGISPVAQIAPRASASFDLRNDEHFRYLDARLTRNAHVWEEPDHEIAYWGPSDDSKWFEVVYRFPFSFPVRAASLYASVDLAEAGAAGFLEVSTDPGHGWTEVARQSTVRPVGGPFDISARVLGARQIYVRGRMKGRDDHAGSCMAQFLRTSTAPDGHLENKSPYVFELLAFDRAVPLVTASLVCSDGDFRRLWVGTDGEFSIDRVFTKAGRKTYLISARAGHGEAVARSFDLWVNTQGWALTLVTPESRILERETYRAAGQLSGAGPGPWSGAVDYADGSGAQPVPIGLEGRFRLEHRFRTTGKHIIRVTFVDAAGGSVTNRATCIVVPSARLSRAAERAVRAASTPFLSFQSERCRL